MAGKDPAFCTMGDLLTAKCVLNLICIGWLLAGGKYEYMMCEQSVVNS